MGQVAHVSLVTRAIQLHDNKTHNLLVFNILLITLGMKTRARIAVVPTRMLRENSAA